MNKWIKDNFTIKELLKFLVGGGSAVLVDATVYALLKHHISISAAKVISYIMGAGVGFLLNKLWTFNSKNFRISEIYKYVMLYACSALANAGINKIVLYLWENTIFAFLCATGTSTIINFLGQKFVVFKKKEVEKR